MLTNSCLLFLLVSVSGELKYPTMIVNLSVFPFNSITFVLIVWGYDRCLRTQFIIFPTDQDFCL